MTPPLLEVSELVVDYPGRGRRRAALRAGAGVSFEVAAGEAFGLVGESGSGKSTIARAILRLQPVTSGRVRFEGREVTGLRGEELRRLRRRVQMVFQDPGAALDPRLTAGEAVTEGLAIHRLVPRAERPARAAGLLAEVGLDPGAAGRLPDAFSGGQRQRIGIARALALEPAFLVCDEPVSALDVSVRAQIVGLLDKLRRRRGLALLLISHDLAVVRQVAARTAVLYAGRIVETGSTGAVLATPRHPYTQALRSAVPVPDPTPRPGRIILAGEARRADSGTAGCPFHARCFHPARDGRCVAERPGLRPVGSALVACHHAT